jgi:hypothetical protein
VDPWFYADRGKRHGPLSLDQLVQTIAAEREPLRVLVWHASLPEWTHAAAVPEIRSRIRSAGRAANAETRNVEEVHEPSAATPSAATTSTRSTRDGRSHFAVRLVAALGVVALLVVLALLFRPSQTIEYQGRPPLLTTLAPFSPRATVAPSSEPTTVAVPAALRFSGIGINVDFRDAPLSQLATLVREFSGLPVEVELTADGTFTYQAYETPWDEVFYRVVIGTGRDYSVDDRMLVRVFRRGAGAPTMAEPLGGVVAKALKRGEQELPGLLLSDLRAALDVTTLMVVREGPTAGVRFTLHNPTAWRLTTLRFRKPSGVMCDFQGLAEPADAHGHFSTHDPTCEPRELAAARGMPPAKALRECLGARREPDGRLSGPRYCWAW